MTLRWVIAALVAVLSGCASLPGSGSAPASPDQLKAWEARSENLARIDRFVVNGRVASGALGFKADLRWKQLPDGRFELRVAGPFGARAAELSGDIREVRVRTGNDAVTTTADPEAWLEQALGCRLPVRGLRWWALGLPDPQSRYDLLLDANGRATHIAQNDWMLDYIEYRMVDGVDLPRRIEARNGDTRVTLLADRWSDMAPSLPPPSPA
ncbi:MAG: lipoprotein insertase outer membrane protein LolB [Panacagrimonas sp.]